MSDNLESDTTANLKKRFVCPRCKREFVAKNNLKQHMLLHNSDPLLAKPFSCPKCPGRFRRRHHLKDHMVVHETEPESRCPFLCTICGERFTRKTSLRGHERQQHNPSIKGENRSALIVNLESDTANLKKRFVCPQCKREFVAKDNLKRHMLLHNSDPFLAKPFPCPKCPGRFRKRHHLKDHMVVHETVPESRWPFICTSCGDRFTLKGNLRRHERQQHNPSEPDGSSLTKGNTVKGNLRRHERQQQHNPSEPDGSSLTKGKTFISCPVCKRKFFVMSNFHHHMSTSHPNIPPSLDICVRR